MFSWRRTKPVGVDGLDNVVWYGRTQDKKREFTQWAEPEFYKIWDVSMQEAFDLLGMMDRFREMTAETAHPSKPGDGGHSGLIPVPGWKNREILRKATFNIDEVTTMLKRIPVEDGIAICFNGKKEDALEQWRSLTELLSQTTVMAIVTPGLLYYIQGTQVGYTPGTRHLFRRSNTVERIGLPNKPHWRAHVSGYVISILGDWDEIKNVHKSTGYNLFQLLQLRLNEELERAVKLGQ